MGTMAGGETLVSDDVLEVPAMVGGGDLRVPIWFRCGACRRGDLVDAARVVAGDGATCCAHCGAVTVMSRAEFRDFATMIPRWQQGVKGHWHWPGTVVPATAPPEEATPR